MLRNCSQAFNQVFNISNFQLKWARPYSQIWHTILNLLFDLICSQKFPVLQCFHSAIKNLILSKKENLLSRCATYLAITNPLTFFSFS